MKALVLHAVGDLRYEDVAHPVRRDGEVLVKIKAAGICGSDVPRVFEKGTYQFPTIPGHEFGGVVVEADEGALIGRKCAVFPLLPCGTCDMCERGAYAQCEDYRYFGSRPVHAGEDIHPGGFAEYISVPLWNVVLADGASSAALSYEEIALCEPCAVALHATEQADLYAGCRVLIYGAGPIGVMAGEWAKIKGAGEVCLFDIDERKAAYANRLGFATAPSGLYDVCIEGTGAFKAWEGCIRNAKPFGTVVSLGNPMRDMTLPQDAYSLLLRKELCLRGTWNSRYSSMRNDWATALSFMPRLGLSHLVSHRFGLSEYERAFGVMRERNEFVNKVMFVMEDLI